MAIPNIYGADGGFGGPSAVSTPAVFAAVPRVALAVTAETAKPDAKLATLTPGSPFSLRLKAVKLCVSCASAIKFV